MDDSMEDFDYANGDETVIRAAHFKFWFRCALDCFFLVLLPIACFIIRFIQKNRNKSIFIQLVILFIANTIFTIRDIMKL